MWEYGTDRWFDALWFSSPLRVARHFIVWVQDDLVSHLVITLRECFIGYTIGTLAGIFIGALLARFDFLGKVLDPFILALNGIPRIALAPLFIIWFGIGEPSKIVLAGMLSFFLCFYATLSGLRSVDPAYLSIARVMGANDRQTFFKVVLPAASPWILTAMKVGVPFALVGAIVGEFMAATAGLRIQDPALHRAVRHHRGGHRSAGADVRGDRVQHRAQSPGSACAALAADRVGRRRQRDSVRDEEFRRCLIAA